MSSRDRLLEAAIAVIEDHGEAALRVDEVAASAGVAKPSLYHFYGSREGVIAAAQAERYRRALLVGFDEIVAQLDHCTSTADLELLVRGWLASFVTDEARRRRAVRLEVLGSSVARPEMRAEIIRADLDVEQQLIRFAEVAIERGWMRLPPGVSPMDLAVWLDGLWNARYGADIAEDPKVAEAWDRVTDAVIDLLLFGRSDTTH
ncbi:MAG: TetR/AcrR family transcriptional regulator [Acidobacteria bacterium]|nr:TetR/AcrR family transcriptional regulator [Acidobacteriota bacterium]